MNWKAILFELLGFVVLVLGNLVYNKIVKIPGITAVDRDEQDPLLADDDEGGNGGDGSQITRTVTTNRD